MPNTPAPLDPQSHTWLELGEVQRLLLDGYPGVVLGLDLEGRLRWTNPAAAERLGFDRGELDGQAIAGTLITLEEPESRAAQLSVQLDQRVSADGLAFGAALRQGASTDAHDWVLRHKDGSPHRTHLVVGALRDHHGSVAGLIAVEPMAAAGDDATLRLTHHDSLTGLPTRAVLQDRAEMALIRATRQKTVLALMLVEIAGFDALCEQYGRSVGDDVLRATAGRLHFELRKTDTAVRLDHGQFAAMLVDLRHADEATLVANKIAAALSAPVNVGVARLTPVARVGVVWFPDHGNQLLPLLHAAEAALATVPLDHGGVAAAPVPAARE